MRTEEPPERIVHCGELISRRRLSVRGLSVLSPSLGWLLFFLIIPSSLLLCIGFMGRTEYGEIEWRWTMENYRRLAGFGSMGWSADYLRILGRSLAVAGVTTLLSVGLAFPLAFFIASRPPRTRYLWLALVVIPICTNLVIRIFAWQLLFSSQLPLARVAAWLGFIEKGRALYPSPLAVYIGMLAAFLPFAALPLYASAERLDVSLIEAARDLYASPIRVFQHAILPQVAPGLKAASILTFIPALGIFVVPDMLGGSKYMLAGNLIQQQFGASRDWPFGAAVSFGLMALTLVGLFLLRRNESERAA